MDALQYLKNGKKISLAKKINNIIAVVSYIKGEHDEALKIINKSIDIQEGKLLYYIFSKKYDTINDFSLEEYRLVMMFYLPTTNKEVHYENFLSPIINQLPDEIRIVIIHDLFNYYKSVKKYKKVLELIERFHLLY